MNMPPLHAVDDDDQPEQATASNAGGGGTDDGDSGDYSIRWAHHAASELVLIKRTGDFIVQVTKGYFIDWETTAEYDHRVESMAGYDADRHAAIDADISYAEEIPQDGIVEGNVRSYLTMLGKARALLLELRYPAAESLTKRATTFIEVRRTDLSRQWFLVATSWAAAAPIALGLTLALFRKDVLPFLGSYALALLLATSAGALGALFSIIRRVGRFEFDLFSGRIIHSMEAVGRIAIGCISALIVALAVEARIISGAWVNGEKPLLALLAVAIVAGTSEQIVSSVIDSVHAGLRSRRESKDPVTPGAQARTNRRNRPTNTSTRTSNS